MVETDMERIRTNVYFVQLPGNWQEGRYQNRKVAGPKEISEYSLLHTLFINDKITIRSEL